MLLRVLLGALSKTPQVPEGHRDEIFGQFDSAVSLAWISAIFRKSLVSVKFLSAILGPEMAAPILWTPGKKRPFCRKNHVHKIPRLGGGILGFGGGGGSADFIFMGARIFLKFPARQSENKKNYEFGRACPFEFVPFNCPSQQY